MAEVLASTEKHYRVADAGDFDLAAADALLANVPLGNKSVLHSETDLLAEQIGEWQDSLYAEGQRSLLLIFQGMDAAGKDSTINKVFRHVDAAGCKVHSFKVPEGEETQHDFLWRCSRQLPRFGEIGIFNRSHYEAVLTERVHPEALSGNQAASPELWAQRYHSIREFERHLSLNGTVVLKFWLYVSKRKQAKRLLKRIDKPEKRWKFSSRDVFVREHWDDYMQAYVEAVNATSRDWAPWYLVPADHKPSMRLIVACLTLLALQKMNPSYPVVSEQAAKEMERLRERLIEPD
ncbi:MAG: polyphosphate kinase 2 family protein [Salinisphaeraceae bacterium]|nr:polyphosphate kinase 2 family protein [Salinisphaeraceae bacterium]